MRRKNYKVGDRIFYETYPNKQICTATIKRIEDDFYLNDKGRKIPFKWLVLWESGNCSSGIEDYSCLPDNDPRVKELSKNLKKFDKERKNIIDSIVNILSPYGSIAQIEIIDLLKIRLNIEKYDR